MAYIGATNPLQGTDSTDTLARDIQLDVLEAFNRKLVFTPLLWTKTIKGGTGGQFIVEGKEDATDGDIATYTRGARVDVTNGTQDEIIINLDRPQYVARRIDKWEEAVSNYDVVAMNVRQIGANLGSFVDRKAAAAVEAASLGTGLVGNGDNDVVVNVDIIDTNLSAKERGDALADAIYEAIASIRENDDYEDVYAVMSPYNYSLLVRSERAVNIDYTSGNGGFDTGTVKTVGGAVISQSNNMPSTADLECLVFTVKAAGIVKLFDVTTKIAEQQEFLDAKLITAYFSNGMGALRPSSAVSIKSA